MSRTKEELERAAGERDSEALAEIKAQAQAVESKTYDYRDAGHHGPEAPALGRVVCCAHWPPPQRLVDPDELDPAEPAPPAAEADGLSRPMLALSSNFRHSTRPAQAARLSRA